MIKKLIEKLKTQKELSVIKKHFRIAKRHKSSEELENVKFELLDFQDTLFNRNILTDFILNEINNLFYEIDYFKINHIPSSDFEW